MMIGTSDGPMPMPPEVALQIIRDLATAWAPHDPNGVFRRVLDALNTSRSESHEATDQERRGQGAAEVDGAATRPEVRAAKTPPQPDAAGAGAHGDGVPDAGKWKPLLITMEVQASTHLVMVARLNTDDGLPRWRAWLQRNPCCCRHAATREAAIDKLCKAFLSPKTSVEYKAVHDG